MAYSRHDHVPEIWLSMTVAEIRNPLKTKNTITAWCPNPVKKYRAPRSQPGL